MTAALKKGPLLGQRHLQTFLLFISVSVNYMTKYNAGVSVVAMTNAETTNPDFPEYDWNEMEKSYILSSFFWGYVVTQFPSGHLCRRFGAKSTMFVSTLGSSFAALLLPFTVDWGDWQVYCVIRAVQGAFQGLLLPCVHTYLAAWCPVEERNRLGALANTGIECGTVMAMFLSGIIATSSMGWPGISYISCAAGVLWCVLWLIFAANTPNESKLISEDERHYIETSKNALKELEDRTKPKNIPIPWRAILSSWPFWSLLAVRSAVGWGFSTIQGEIPTYMNGVLGMDMANNTLYSALPYFAMWGMSYVYLITADILMQRKIVTLNVLRKSINTVGCWIPALGLIGVGFVDQSQQTLAIVLLTAIVGINSGATIGCGLNTIDLSPNHAGFLMALVNGSASITQILTPLLVGAVVQNEDDRTDWQIVFAISAAVLFFGNLLFIVCGSTELQKWDAEDFLKSKDIQSVESADKNEIIKSTEKL